MTDSYRLGEYLLGMQGLAILRAWGTDAESIRARAGEIESISAGLKVGPYSHATAVPLYDAESGYRAWASGYDAMPNLVINIEERTVHPLMSAAPAGRAIDAACGTGRHARWLAERGHDIVGVDASEEMLAIARQKVPAARFQIGQLEAMDLPPASADLVVCALALTHLPELDSAIAELARVLVPGGRLILSDVHPFCTALGVHAFFRSAAGERGCIRNEYHPVSSYLAAFKAANLELVQCIEAPWDQEAVTALPTYSLIPRALEGALIGLPLLLVWELARR